MRRCVHELRTRSHPPPRLPPPGRAQRPRRLPRPPRGLRPEEALARARASRALLVPPPRARALEERRPLPQDGRRADPAVPFGLRAPPRRSPLSHHRLRALEGRHASEPGRGPAPVLPPLRAGGGRGRGRDLPRRGAALARRGDGGPGAGSGGRSPFGRSRTSSSGRTTACQLGPSAGCHDVAGGRAARPHCAGHAAPGNRPRSPHRHRPPHRRPPPAPRHRLQGVPGEAREGARLPLPLPPRRPGRGDPRSRARPPPLEGREEEGPDPEAEGRAAPVQAGHRPRPRPARGLEARRRPVPVAPPLRRDLRLHAPLRARPRRAGGVRRTRDRRQPSRALPVHNEHAARAWFGDDWMDRFARRAGSPGCSSASGP